MNKFIQKLKNSNKVYLSILIITLIAYIIGYTIFVKNIAVLTGIETLVRMILIILFGIWFLVWLIMGLVYVINKKYSSFIIMIIFSLCPIDFSDTYLAKVIIPLLCFSSFLLPFWTVSELSSIVYLFLFDRLFAADMIFIVYFATIFT